MLNRIKKLFCFFLISAAFCCSPKIYSFTADALAVSSEDSIRVHWKVRGTPTLLIHQKQLARGAETVTVAELTLVAEKGNKEPARRFIQVEIRNGRFVDTLAFSTVLEGDSVLVAKGAKSAQRWSNFEVLSIASASLKDLRVVHQSITAFLAAAGGPSAAMQGQPYSGAWEIRYRLTEAEKKDPSQLLTELQVQALIQPKK